MVYKIADNVISPLGWTTEQNYKAVKAGRSALRSINDFPGIPDPFAASLLNESQNAEMSVKGLSRFEAMVTASVKDAINKSAIDIFQKRVVFILSTTKGNIEWLSGSQTEEKEYPGVCAKRIINTLDIKATPIVVCNACISGLSAIILASRLLECDFYDYAIVCGADCQGQFIISGFQSFKALSDNCCKPFDGDRTGLNLGEAAATIILGRQQELENSWGIKKGSVKNDAYHISAPSKKGEGAFLALCSVLAGEDLNALAMINAHGTATMFNDQMESVAMDRAGLAEIPVNSLKGYFGHTMGAAGVLETIITMKAIDDQTILGTKGFSELGVSGNIYPVKENLFTKKSDFIKMLSGFGGCNAAIWCTHHSESQETALVRQPKTTHHVTISPNSVVIDGVVQKQVNSGKQMLSDIYKYYVGDYPKYYKMDMLSRLGFVASEILLKADCHEPVQRADMAIVLFNRASSIDADIKYQESISSSDDYYPSPSLFVYTLPNIVTGEIAIRNGYNGETSFYVLPERDDVLMNQVVEATLKDESIKRVLTGWLDYVTEQDFLADLYLQVVEE